MHLLFGSAIDLDRGILSDNSVEKYDELSAHLSDLLRRLILAQKIVAYRLDIVDNKHLCDNMGMEITQFPVDSYVTANYSKSMNENIPPHKLMTFRQGPYSHIFMILKGHYLVLDLATR